MKKIENCKSYWRKKRKTVKNVDFRILPRIYGEMRHFLEKSSSIKKSLSSKVTRELQKISSIPPIGRKINRKRRFFNFSPFFGHLELFFSKKFPHIFYLKCFLRTCRFPHLFNRDGIGGDRARKALLKMFTDVKISIKLLKQLYLGLYVINFDVLSLK